MKGWKKLGILLATLTLAVTVGVLTACETQESAKTVVFKINDTVVKTETVEHGQKVEMPTATPTDTGKKFDYWVLEGTTQQFDFNTAIIKDTVIVAKWKDEFTIVFKNDSATYETAKVFAGEKLVKPTENPSKSGFEFDYWAVENTTTPYDFNATVNSSFGLTAIYKQRYKVTFNEYEGSSVEKYVTEGKTTTPPQPAPSLPNQEFLGWKVENTLDSELVNFSSFVFVQDTEFYPVFEPKTRQIIWTNYVMNPAIIFSPVGADSLPSTAKYGDVIYFSVQFDSDYDFSNAKIYANGEEIFADNDEVYSFTVKGTDQVGTVTITVDGYVAYGAMTGSGTEQSPYLIYSPSQLLLVAQRINSNYGSYRNAYYKLMKDIDLDGMEWTPIGTCYENSFYGNFDGDNHTISNFKITQTSGYVTDSFGEIGVGFFGYVGYQYTQVNNLHIENASIALTYALSVNTTYFVGTIIGHMGPYASMENCGAYQTDVLVFNTSETVAYVGGLVGTYLGGDAVGGNGIYACYFEDGIVASYSTTSAVGGIVGSAEAYVTQSLSLSAAPIEYCFVFDAIIVGSTFLPLSSDQFYAYPIWVGGIAGYTYSVSIYDCYADIELAAEGGTAYAGGIVGDADVSADFFSIEYCYVEGTIEAYSFGDTSEVSEVCVGGIAGTLLNAGVFYCETNVSIFGYAEDTSYVGTVFAGGIAGFVDTNYYVGTVAFSFAVGNITITHGYAGGIAGYNFGTVASCYYIGEVYAGFSKDRNTSISSSSIAGGIVAINESGAIVQNCFASGIAMIPTMSNSGNAGGIVGSNYGDVYLCYRSSTQIVRAGETATTKLGELATEADLKNEAFLKQNLYFTDDDWSFEGSYPELQYFDQKGDPASLTLTLVFGEDNEEEIEGVYGYWWYFFDDSGFLFYDDTDLVGFEGWYIDSGCTIAFNIFMIAYDNLTIYAKYTA